MGREILYFIPARSGSKSILHKNLQLINGISLVERAVKIACCAADPSKVVLSSDSNLILDKANGSKITTHLRSSENSNDNATTESAIIEFLKKSKSHHKWVVLIEPTSPFLSLEDINTLLEISSSTTAKSIYSIARVRHTDHYLNQRGKISGNEKIDFLFPLEREKKRLKQEKRITYKFGNISAIKSDALMAGEKFFSGNSETFEIPFIRSINIDSKEELLIARSLASFDPTLFDL